MELTRRIRNERKFENGNALVEQIKNDRQTAQALLYEADGMPVKEVGA
jgi:FAD synthase